MKLAGKTALVTGGTTGIGLETARAFLDNGAKVLVTGQNPDRIKLAQEELGKNAIVIQNDAGSVEAAHALAKIVAEKFGTLDVAFLNAGVFGLTPLGNITEAEFDREFAINVKGPLFQFQALLPHLKKPGASVILTSSIAGTGSRPGMSVYGATKAAVNSIGFTLAKEVASEGIRVNIVSPGPIETPIFGKVDLPAAQLQAIADGILSSVPMGRFGQPGEVARGVLYLASDDSSFVTGSELIIGGGGQL
jgi:NAD(P)-dependent dehydrogenase (short-subunit alcohol dehydrogenase family)